MTRSLSCWPGLVSRMNPKHWDTTGFWWQLGALVGINFCQAVMLTAPFTISVYMVRRFEEERLPPGVPVDEQRVGRLTGLLAGAFSMAAFVTSMVWGILSNYLGRKPVLMIGLGASFISMVCFGLSTSFTSAMLARAFGGVLNGVLGAWKCLIGESGDSLVQGKMFGYMSLAWGLGTTIGPVVGGALAQPCNRHPNMAGCAPGQIFYERPFFLPCFVGSLTILYAAVFTQIVLKETLRPSTKQQVAQVWGPRFKRLKALIACQPVAAPPACTSPSPDTPGMGPTLDRTLDRHPMDAERSPLIKKRAPGAKGGHLGGDGDDRGDPPSPVAVKKAVSEPDAAGESESFPLLPQRGSAHVGSGVDSNSSICRSISVTDVLPASRRDVVKGGDRAQGRAAVQPDAVPVPDGLSPASLELVVMDRDGGRDGGRDATTIDLGHSVSHLNLGRTWSATGIMYAPDSLPGGTVFGSRGRYSAPGTESAQSTPKWGVKARAVGAGLVHNESSVCDRTLDRVDRGEPLPSDRGLRRDGEGPSSRESSSGSGDDEQHGEHDTQPLLFSGQLRDVPMRSGTGSTGGTSPHLAVRINDSPQYLGPTPSSPSSGSGTRVRTRQGSEGARLGRGDNDGGAPCGTGWGGEVDTCSTSLRLPDSPGRAGTPRGETRPGSFLGRSLSSLRVDSVRARMTHLMRTGSRVYFATPILPFTRRHDEARSLLSGQTLSHTSSAAVITAPGGTGLGPDGCRDTGADRPRDARSDRGAAAAIKPAARVEGGCSEGGTIIVWHKNRQVLLTITAYGFCSFLYCALDELIPIWAAAPLSTGGLGLEPSELAPPMTVYGVALMVYSAFGYPTLQRILGTQRLARWGLVTAVGVCLMLPATTSAMKTSKVLANVVLFGCMIIKCFAQSSAFTGALVMVNAAPHSSQLGEVNGVGQTVAALVRGVGPMLGGVLWAASISLHMAGQEFLPFICVSSLAVASHVFYGMVNLPNLN